MTVQLEVSTVSPTTWLQLTEEPLFSAHVDRRMQEIARRWWLRYRGQITVTVTARDRSTGETREVVHAGFDGDLRRIICPHCGSEIVM
jgi:hypothetical protein